MIDQILNEGKRLHDLGFAIHWLHAKSKRPVDSGWTTGPRKSWADLRAQYKKGMNVGVRLGSPSVIDGKFLAVIDVDVKSSAEDHRQEVLEVLGRLVSVSNLPQVLSGRGNGSRHYYLLTAEPQKPFIASQSKELVRVHMPSATKPSKREREALSPEELEAGVRLRAAWEISVMGDGQQVVLPPSIHPDSGGAYTWAEAVGFEIPVLDLSNIKAEGRASDTPTAKSTQPDNIYKDYAETPTDLAWLPINERVREMIMTGKGVEDRSAALLPIGHALFNAGLTRDEILTVLTDPTTFMGACAYEHAKTKSRKRAAQWVWKYSIKKVFDEHDTEKMFAEPVIEARELSFDEQTKSEEAVHEFVDWRTALDITKDDKYKATLRNSVIILTHESPELIKRDLFSVRDFYGVKPKWKGEAGAAIVDGDITEIKLWLSNNFGIEPNKTIIGEAVAHIANANAFDPVVDWLEALPPWDERLRLDSWLKDNFEAQGNAEYLAQVFRKWMVAMVARALVPGIKFDWMPIFEGAQGVGKSSFGRLLVGDEYFTDWLPDLANKDAALALQGSWAVELGELAALRKNEIENVKAFITRQVDKLRPPYGERTIHSYRRCVFFGTTNNATYLKDDSGNRRFKPVVVGRLNFEALRAERTQLFAEALGLWKSGFESASTLDLIGEAAAFEREIQAEKMVADEADLMRECLAIFMEKEAKKADEKTGEENALFGRFRMRDLFDETGAIFQGEGPLANWKFDSRNAQFAAKALKSLNFKKTKNNGVEYWVLKK